MNELPENLEARIAEERERLHVSVAELRSRLSDTVSLKRNTRRHLGIACGVAVVVGLTTGYSFASIFTNHERKPKWQF